MNIEQIIELQKARMSIYGDSRENILNDTIFSNFEDNPSYRKVEFKGEVIGVHFIEGATNTKDNTINRYIIPKPPIELKGGDMVIDEYGRTWMCMIVNNLHYNKVVAIPCNHILTWQDESNVIHTTPCILSDKTSVYSDGLSKTEFISLGTDQTSIIVQANVDTLKIPLNKRFIFKNDGNNIYEVNRRDNLTLDGLISFVVKKSLYSPLYDNLELNIANYNGEQPDPEPKPPEDTTAIEITGAERLTIWDKDNEYAVNTTKPVIWTLNREDIVKFISKADNKCIINPVGTSKIGESILRCTLVENADLYVEKKISLFYQ